MRSTRSAPTAAELRRWMPDAVEIRVVGCLIEKQRTTPDVYPLSLNSLRIACNQATNRDPVVDYDEATVLEALRRLALRGWTRLASGPGGRARKYRHLLDDALDLDEAELSLLGGADAARAADAGRAEAAQRADCTPSPISPRSRRRSSGWSSAGQSPATRAGRGRRRSATSSCSARASRLPASLPPRGTATSSRRQRRARSALGCSGSRVSWRHFAKSSHRCATRSAADQHPYLKRVGVRKHTLTL